MTEAAKGPPDEASLASLQRLRAELESFRSQSPTTHSAPTFVAWSAAALAKLIDIFGEGHQFVTAFRQLEFGEYVSEQIRNVRRDYF